MARSLPFHRSLLGRGMLLGVLPAALVVLAVVGLNSARAWVSVSGSLEDDIRRAAELLVRELDARNDRNLALARLVAATQESGQFGRRDEALRMLGRLVRETPGVYGASIAYEPDADGRDAELGRMFAYVRRDPGAPGGVRVERLESGLGSGDADMWYWMPRERFERTRLREALITRPHAYQGVDIVEHVAPIVVDGRFAGVAGVDVALTELQGELEAIAGRLGAEILVETRGVFVAAVGSAGRHADLRAKRVAETDLGPLFAEAAARGDGSWEAEDAASGASYFCVTASVPAGGWRVIVRKPMSAVTDGIAATVWSNLATAVVGISIIVGLLAAGVVAIARRIRAAHLLAERIAGGDLASAPVSVRGGDETAELVSAMNRMNADLARIVTSVREASARLGATSTQLGATSREQRTSVGALGESTAQIAAAIHEIAATGNELLRTVEAVDGGARRTQTAAAAGRSRLEGVSETMVRLDAGARAIDDRLEVIAEKAAAISSVVVAISKVAEQTNLLSVNAAIEAEKAGESGLGFLVVAREIRRLADQTAGASLDIERIVGQMQSSVRQGVAEMERFSGDMRKGTEDVQAAASDLGGMIGAIESSYSRFTEVRSGMSTQSAGVAQIETAVAQVAEGARSSAAAAGELARVADEVAYAVAVLQDAAARFRLRDEEAT